MAKELGKTVAELSETLTVEEMIGWAAFFELKNEEEKKEMDKIQKRSVMGKAR